MDYKDLRNQINQQLGNSNSAKTFLQTNIGIDVNKAGYFKVRADERTPSTIINKGGSFHDYGSGEHYRDVVALLFDGYHAFDSLPKTMEWVCDQLDINMGGNQ